MPLVSVLNNNHANERTGGQVKELLLHAKQYFIFEERQGRCSDFQWCILTTTEPNPVNLRNLLQYINPLRAIVLI